MANISMGCQIYSNKRRVLRFFGKLQIVCLTKLHVAIWHLRISVPQQERCARGGKIFCMGGHKFVRFRGTQIAYLYQQAGADPVPSLRGARAPPNDCLCPHYGLLRIRFWNIRKRQDN